MLYAVVQWHHYYNAALAEFESNFQHNLTTSKKKIHHLGYANCIQTTRLPEVGHKHFLQNVQKFQSIVESNLRFPFFYFTLLYYLIGIENWC